jgi:hypothetical protein
MQEAASALTLLPALILVLLGGCSPLDVYLGEIIHGKVKWQPCHAWMSNALVPFARSPPDHAYRRLCCGWPRGDTRNTGYAFWQDLIHAEF